MPSDEKLYQYKENYTNLRQCDLKEIIAPYLEDKTINPDQQYIAEIDCC
jgi:hypothetical protein